MCMSYIRKRYKHYSMLANKKSIYVLSDTKRIGKFTNFPLIPKRGTDYHVVPAFESQDCIEYVKNTTKHPYYVVMLDHKILERNVPAKVKIAVISSIFCSLEDRKEYITYELSGSVIGGVLSL